MKSINSERYSLRQYQSLSAYLQEAREEERKSIAREIHDELGQVLTSIKLHLSLLPEEIKTDVVAALDRTMQIQKQVDSAITTVKNIITKLRPGLLDDLGLIAAIEWQANEFQHQSGIVCDVHLPADEYYIPPELSTLIFRILQEALTNILRHSKATRVNIDFRVSSTTLELLVRDNGRGITDEEINHPQSFGIIGMKERVQSFNGTLMIHGIPQKGTVVHVTIPYQMELTK